MAAVYARRRTVGALAAVALAVLGCLMVSHALRVDHQQQLQWERAQ